MNQHIISRQRLIAANIVQQFIGSTINVQEELETFEKGIVDEFRYGENKNIIQIKKSGKELKTALEQAKTRMQDLSVEFIDKANELKKEIDIDPTEEYQSYRLEKYPVLGNIGIKTYDVYSHRNKETTSYSSNEETENICRMMYQYNNYVERYVDAKIQVAMLTTLINNVDEKKTYPLNIELATMLGL